MSKLSIRIKHFVPNLSEKGFSLAEVLISTAILGILVVATVSQLNLSYKQSFNSQADAEINNVINQVTSAIGVTSVCTDNFRGNPVVKNDYLQITTGAPPVPLIQVGGAAGISDREIQITRIATKNTAPISPNEIILEISFQKRGMGINGFLARTITREISLTVTLNAGLIESCSANYDSVIKSAIEQSCRGNASRYDPTIDPINYPYGRCLHNVSPAAACAQVAEFLTTVSLVANEVQYPACGKVAAPIANNCPVLNQVAVDYDANGVPVCQYLLPSCGLNEVLVKSGASQVCRNVDCTAEPVLSAFTGFDAGGNKICTPITNTAGCPPGQYTTNITSTGSISCSSPAIAGGNCPEGHRVEGLTASGAVICTKFVELPFSCPVGFGLTGFDATGNRLCQKLERVLACDGTRNSHSYSVCTLVGGTVVGANTPNSHCRFNGSTCPGGWSQCLNYGRQIPVNCFDSSNTYYCNSYRLTRTVPPGGGGVYGNFPLNSLSCYRWNGASGNGKSCSPSSEPPTYSTRNQVGCY